MRRTFGPKIMTRSDDAVRFESWLFGAREAVVLAATVAAVQAMFGRLDPRLVETKLLARQGALQRQADQSQEKDKP